MHLERLRRRVPPAGAATIALEGCFQTKTGEGCDPGTWGGGCLRKWLWTLCGPLPGTTGGCCYEAIVVSSIIYE